MVSTDTLGSGFTYVDPLALTRLPPPTGAAPPPPRGGAGGRRARQPMPGQRRRRGSMDVRDPPRDPPGPPARPVAQAPERRLRDPGPGQRPRRPARGRGPPHPQAQRGQPRRLRVRGPRHDRAGHRRRPAERTGLLRLARHHLRPPGRRGPLRGRARVPAPRRRRRLPRQRRVRADHHVDAGPARRRRRGAGPGARLPAVDGGGQPGRRHPGALPGRRDRRLEPRPGRRRGPHHRAHQGAGGHQPQQPDGRGVLAPGAARPRRARPPPRPAAAGRRDLRPGAVRGRRARVAGDARARPAVPHVQRPVQDLPGRRVPLGLAGHHGSEGARRGVPRGHPPAGVVAPVPQRARAARHPGRAQRPPEHRGPGPARAVGCSSSATRPWRGSTPSPA